MFFKRGTILKKILSVSIHRKSQLLLFYYEINIKEIQHFKCHYSDYKTKCPFCNKGNEKLKIFLKR